jgi:hypothetical protein
MFDDMRCYKCDKVIDWATGGGVDTIFGSICKPCYWPEDDVKKSNDEEETNRV